MFVVDVSGRRNYIITAVRITQHENWSFDSYVSRLLRVIMKLCQFSLCLCLEAFDECVV